MTQSDSVNVKIAIFGLLILLTGAIIYNLVVYPAAPELTEFNSTPAFSPHAVVEIQFKTDHEDFTFTRSTSNESWVPQVSAMKISRKLNLMALIKSRSSIVRGPAKMRILIKFNDSTTQTADFDGVRLIWTSGPRSGQSSLIGKDDLHHFVGGPWSFGNDEIEWCLGRPAKITLPNGRSFANVAGHWRDTRASEPALELDSNFLESWLSSFCVIKTEGDVDLSQHKLDLQKTIEIAFDNNSVLPIRFGSHSKWVQIGTEPHAILSSEFFGALQQLSEPPVRPSK